MADRRDSLVHGVRLKNMLSRANVRKGDSGLVTGASGGVGVSALQLAKRCGAEVIGICSPQKCGQVVSLGAESVEVVVDLVADSGWPELPEVLKRGGPMMTLDVCTGYLKNLALFGCTALSYGVFADLVRYIENGEISPSVAKTCPLQDIVRAQKEFVSNKLVGKLVLISPAVA